MRTIKIIALFNLLAAFFTSTACAPNKQWRTHYTPCTTSAEQNCDQSAISTHFPGTDSAFELGFVEYNDQGLLRDRNQMMAVLEHYYPIAGTEDVILTVFVHGWHHNAAPNDSNIESFKGMLKNISKNETIAAQQDGRAKRRILGVYIGWRGETITVPLLTHLSFWPRKAVAQEVGLQGVSEVLLKLEQIVNVKAGFEDIPRPLNSRMVVIGHSFGGAVVYTSLQQILTDRYLDSHRGKTFQDSAKGFGDLVVLMNPAFEATRYATLFDLSQSCIVNEQDRSCRGYSKNQMPRLVILTSETDYATRIAFPIGRYLYSLRESHDTLQRYISTSEGPQAFTLNEAKADYTTVGHFKPFWTHKLEPKAQHSERQKEFQWRSLQQNWSNQTHNDHLEFERATLKHLGRTSPLNPYLNVSVSRSLIKDHNDIWGNSIQSLLQDLIVIATTPIEHNTDN